MSPAAGYHEGVIHVHLGVGVQFFVFFCKRGRIRKRHFRCGDAKLVAAAVWLLPDRAVARMLRLPAT